LRKVKNRLRLIALFLGGLSLFYCAGYLLCRRRRIIVHTSACAAAQYSFHDVVAGDAKLSMLNPAMETFYTPLRFVERFYWYRAKPIGSPCP
jgi:hypothetical protein